MEPESELDAPIPPVSSRDESSRAAKRDRQRSKGKDNKKPKAPKVTRNMLASHHHMMSGNQQLIVNRGLYQEDMLRKLLVERGIPIETFEEFGTRLTEEQKERARQAAEEAAEVAEKEREESEED